MSALSDRLADALLASDSLGTRIRAGIENWNLTKISVGAIALDRKPNYFLSSGSALLHHALSEAWSHFIRPTYSGVIFFLDDLHNLATPTIQDTALIIRDQFQSFGIEAVNFSVCLSAKPDHFSGIRSFAEPAVRFYNKCFLEPITPEETLEYTRAVFGSTRLDSLKMSQWLYSKTFGHPYFLAFICCDLWTQYHARPFTNAAPMRHSTSKLTLDLYAQALPENKVTASKAIAGNLLLPPPSTCTAVQSGQGADEPVKLNAVHQSPSSSPA